MWKLIKYFRSYSPLNTAKIYIFALALKFGLSFHQKLFGVLSSCFSLFWAYFIIIVFLTFDFSFILVLISSLKLFGQHCCFYLCHLNETDVSIFQMFRTHSHLSLYFEFFCHKKKIEKKKSLWNDHVMFVLLFHIKTQLVKFTELYVDLI